MSRKPVNYTNTVGKQLIKLILFHPKKIPFFFQFAVVTSFDPHFNYVKIMKAVNYLKDPDTPFIATHEDMTYPGPNPGWFSSFSFSTSTLIVNVTSHIIMAYFIDLIIPAAGTTSTIIRAFTGRKPIVMGKPHKATWNYIVEHFRGEIDPRRTLMTGDRFVFFFFISIIKSLNRKNTPTFETTLASDLDISVCV